MIYIYPDFYNSFQCRASGCGHTCCRDWEIDVDDESIERFSCLPESREILSHIEQDENPHIVLTENGTCPFLNKRGLCRIILAHGEEIVPYICREHPRFYNEYDGFIECGLGLSCEETVSLLLNCRHLDFFTEADDETEGTACSGDEFLQYKYLLIKETGEGSDVLKTLEEKIRAFGDDIPDTRKCLEVFSGLDYFTQEWPRMLSECTEADADVTGTENDAVKILAQYLLFRSLTSEDDGILLYVYASLIVIMCLLNRGFDIGETIRLFSSEIEYSDSNIDTVADALVS